MTSIDSLKGLVQKAHTSLPWLWDSIIILTRGGSWAYGLNTSDSDEDYRGIAVSPREYLLGFTKRFEHADQRSPDISIHEIRKFFSLACDANPNILETLWVEPEDQLLVTKASDRLVENRRLFLSKKVRWSYSGYALSQLKRIQRHRRWLVSPPKGLPNRADFGLSEGKFLDDSQLGAAIELVLTEFKGLVPGFEGLEDQPKQAVAVRLEKALFKVLARSPSISIPLGTDNFLHLLAKEKAFRDAQKEWTSYSDWKTNRNPARAAIEAKYGLDLKHATHLVRLLRTCREILTSQEILVRRPDREQLLAIRNGAWSYEQLVDWATKEDEELNILMSQSSLPHTPDRKTLDQLCIELVESSLGV